MTMTNMTDRPLDDPWVPTLQKLGETIDREFQRRDPKRPTAVEYVAAWLGVPSTDLSVATRTVEPVVAHAVGRWLLEAQQQYDAAHVGADPHLPASTELVQGADGDVRAFRNVLVLLPAGAVHPSPVAVRMYVGRFGAEVELLGRPGDGEPLAETLGAFLEERRTADSPYRLGSYRVSVRNGALVLTRWAMPAANRRLLRVDDSVWQTLDRSVHRVLALAEQLAERGLGTSAGVLLVGPPGTGKTQLGMVVAGELAGRATVLVPGSYVTEHWLTELFDLAADLSPCLILMDDLDLIAGERGQSQPHRLREFLNVMDGGLADRSGVVVIASTNDHRKIDKAAQRSSRFDTVIRMEAPGFEGRLSILRRYLAWCEVALDLEAVARATDGATGADLKELVRATVLATDDRVTTGALLARAAEGRWRGESAPAGVYL